LICGHRFIQLGTHVVQRHHMSARRYRERMDLEVKRGTVPAWYRRMKGIITIQNDTYKNLKTGRRFRFKRGDKVGSYRRSPITIARVRALGKRQYANQIH
jgi:hypothetical protein